MSLSPLKPPAVASIPLSLNAVQEIVRGMTPSAVTEIDCTDGENPLRRPQDFFREHVSASKPAVLRGAASHWPAVTKWRRRRYIIDALPDVIPVALTPDGFADAIRPGLAPPAGAPLDRPVFVEPLEASMTARHFFSLLDRCEQEGSAPNSRVSANRSHRPSSGGDDALVPYCQPQNNSLAYPEFRRLRDDLLDQDIHDFGELAFGQGPCEASNIWIGGARSVTTLHQDWYENLYVVITGTKRFTLLPPWSSPLVPKITSTRAKWEISRRRGDAIPTARQEEASGGAAEGRPVVPDTISIDDITLARVMTEEEVTLTRGDAEAEGVDADGGATTPWIGELSPEARAAALYVEVHAGDLLYLPAMWYHEVAQRVDMLEDDDDAVGAVIAVNFWFDMNFESPVYHLQQLIKAMYNVS